MKFANKLELRRLWFTIHKWLGLCLAVPVVLVFLSGSALVWKGSLDDLMHPQRRVSAAATHPPSFYVAAVERVLGPDDHLADLKYPRGQGTVVVTAVTVAKGSGMQRRMRYFLHPATGQLLDRSEGDGRLAGRLHVLHGSLFLGWAGGRFVGVTALVLLLSAFSGLWLWWPMKPPAFRGLRWRRTQSTNANLHHQAGFWAALPLIVLSFTGATISFQRYFIALTGEAAAVGAENIRASAPPLPDPRLNVTRVLAAAGSPRDLSNITWPTTLDRDWLVVSEASQRIIVVDDATGRAAVQSASQSETTARLMRRIHDGTGMPFAWQIVIFVTGLVGAVMAVTGMIMWFKGQVRDARLRGRRAARVRN